MLKFKLEDSIGFLVGRAARVMGNKLNRNFVQSGYLVTLDHWIILNRTLMCGGQNQQDLAMMTGRDKAAIARLLEGMEKEGWIRREQDENDRRNKLVYITEKGKTLRERLLPIVGETISAVEEGIDKKSMETCKQVLRQIFENTNL